MERGSEGESCGTWPVMCRGSSQAQEKEDRALLLNSLGEGSFHSMQRTEEDWGQPELELEKKLCC